MQLNHEIVEYFKEWEQAIETNGTNKVPENLDWVCVSPKVAEHVLKRNFTKVNELKYIIHTGKQIPKPENITTLAQLKKSGYQTKSIKQELRDNLINSLKKKNLLFKELLVMTLR